MSGLMLSRGGLAIAAGASHTPMMQGHIRRTMEIEGEDARLAVVMGCFHMPPQDGARYAQEARACVGSKQAYEAACTGHPFMLPWRGPA